MTGEKKPLLDEIAEVEGVRVAALIKRDRAERERDEERARARAQVENGDYTNFADIALEPTAEWLAQGDTRPFTPKQPNDTVRVLKSVRRVQTPIVMRMFTAGKLNDEQFAACIWYRNQHEAAGLEGRWASTQLSDAGGGGAGLFGGHMARHAHEAEAREAFRAASAAIPGGLLKFFDAVVLNDIPLRRASAFARCDNSRAASRFRSACSALVSHCEAVKVDVLKANEIEQA